MTSDDQLSLFPEPEPPDAPVTPVEQPTAPVIKRDPSDNAARLFATDPRHNVVLEASAGTGKTSVLVGRYLNLLRVGVDPSHILAMTFTRQAAAEMRARIIGELRVEAESSASARARWDALRARLGEIAISTVDAFCLALLREFPLEADLDPGFSLVDDTEVPRLLDEAVERTLALGALRAHGDDGVAMLLGQPRTRANASSPDASLAAASRRAVGASSVSLGGTNRPVGDVGVSRGSRPVVGSAGCGRSGRRTIVG